MDSEDSDDSDETVDLITIFQKGVVSGSILVFHIVPGDDDNSVISEHVPDEEILLMKSDSETAKVQKIVAVKTTVKTIAVTMALAGNLRYLKKKAAYR